MTHTEKRSNRKLIVLCLLVVLLLAAAAFGTMAWLTASDSVTNTFTVGNFNEPKPDPDDSSPDNPTPDPEDPDKPTATNPAIGGYIYEPSWDTTAEHKLIPGGSLYKDPFVGIGKDSEDAVVYVYVENPFKNGSVYFTLNDGWEAVGDQGTNYFTTTVPEGEPGKTYYTGGLFQYKAGLTADKEQDVWTSKPVFSKVTVKDGATKEELNVDNTTEGSKDIVVYCYLHQAKDGTDDIDAEAIKEAAIVWSKLDDKSASGAGAKVSDAGQP